MMWQVALLTVATYLIASIPMSMVVGYLVTGKDIREFGDGNPGATNVQRVTGSVMWYIIAVILDGFKGLFPVGIPYQLMGWTGFEIVSIAIAAILGHAFMLYLGFKGGKAVAISGGVWTGLLLWEGVAVYAILLVLCYMFIDSDDWVIAFLMGGLLVWSLVFHFGNWVLVAVWVGNAAIVLYKHRDGLTTPPVFKNPFAKQRED